MAEPAPPHTIAHVDQRAPRDRGFTLVEVVVAVVLVGVLVAVAVVGVSRLTSQGSAAACVASADAGRGASSVHFATAGAYPATFTHMVSTGSMTVPAGAQIASGGRALTGSGWQVQLRSTGPGAPPRFECVDTSATDEPMVIAVDTTRPGASPRQVTLPLRGEVSVTIDWGGPTEGCPTTVTSAQQTTDTTCTYAADGQYEIELTGRLERYGTGSAAVLPSPDNSDRVTAVLSWGGFTPASLAGAFTSAEFLTAVPDDLPRTVTSLAGTFAGTTRFDGDITSWDTSFVSDMTGMFRDATGFRRNLASWCVPLIPSAPADFATGTPDWVLPKPTWGSCPSGPFPPWPIMPTGAQFAAATSSWTSTGTASATQFAGSYADVNKWFGGVLGPDGKVYGIPFHSSTILVIDPVSGTATRTTMGASIAGGIAQWAGGVLGPDGKIYAAPRSADTILVIDPLAGTARTWAPTAINLADANKWTGGVLGPNGKIYFIPENAADLLVVDPVAGTAVRSALGAAIPTGNTKWSGAVLGPDGRIYAIPRHASSILVIDPTTGANGGLGSASLVTLGADLTGLNKWGGGALAPNGKIYGIPLDASSILVIDPLAGTATTWLPGGVSLSGTAKWGGGALAVDGRIYAVPRNSADMLVIDPSGTGSGPHGTVTRPQLLTGLTAGTLRWVGAVAHPNGSVYGMPYSQTAILRITTPGSGAGSSDVLLSPFVNGY